MPLSNLSNHLQMSRPQKFVLQGQRQDIFLIMISSANNILSPKDMPRQDLEFCLIFVDLFNSVNDFPRCIHHGES
jgi:predicted Ser/Thr protein kinase